MNATITNPIGFAASYNKAVEVMAIIGIPQKAIKKAHELQNEIAFMIRNGMDAEKFAFENVGIMGTKLLQTLSAERKTLLDETRYASFEEFLEAFNVNQSASVERLFGEFFQDGKMKRFYEYVGSDLLTIYTLHTQYPYKRFMGLVEYL